MERLKLDIDTEVDRAGHGIDIGRSKILSLGIYARHRCPPGQQVVAVDIDPGGRNMGPRKQRQLLQCIGDLEIGKTRKIVGDQPP